MLSLSLIINENRFVRSIQYWASTFSVPVSIIPLRGWYLASVISIEYKVVAFTVKVTDPDGICHI